jgi:hypothetical protein
MNNFIITSILGLIFLGIGLAIRFKIRSDNKKGIFHEDTYSPLKDENDIAHDGNGLSLGLSLSITNKNE